MFKIHHFANSFISVESKDSIITCDPWIGKTNDNGWFSYPIRDIKEIEKKIFSSKFVYISHLHCDHLDFKTLKKFNNKSLTFVIKKFNNGILKRRLQRFSKNIIELEPFKKKRINKDFTVAIIPQIISNSSNLPDNIQYDLDTSIIIQSNKNKTIFYNNVDTPINLKTLKRINNFVKTKFKKKIDAFCYALGAASEFPQCFLNINRDKEKRRIINESLKEIRTYLNYLKPKVFFPAGGTYSIYGKFHKLNKYIAQPSFSQIVNKLSKSKTKIYNLIGGGSICFDNNKHVVNEKNKIMKNGFNKTFINKVKNLNYYYSNGKSNINLTKLDGTFLSAKKNYLNILSSKKKIKSKWDVYFKIYKNYEINEKCSINNKKSEYLKTYHLKNYNSNSKKKFKLECHIEYELFKSLLSGKFPWNTSLSGSTIMYRRFPNKYNVDMVFSLNFLRI